MKKTQAETEPSSTRLYDSLKEKLGKILKTVSQKEIGWLAKMMSGIFQSRSVQHRAIVGAVVWGICQENKMRQIRRFFSQMTLDVTSCYETVMKPILEKQTKTRRIKLIIDSSQITGRYQLMVVAMVYRTKVIPVVWRWVLHGKGHSQTIDQIDLLRQARAQLPKSCRISLCGDSEFGAVDVLKVLDLWGWQVALRQMPNTLTQKEGSPEHAGWQKLIALCTKGQSRWHLKMRLTQTHGYLTSIAAHWEHTEDEPWILATNYPHREATLGCYRRRSRIEPFFRDLKSQGFNLDRSGMTCIKKLSKLVFMVFLLYLWCLAWGSQKVKKGQRGQVDRTDTPKLSLFQLGFQSLIECLTQGLRFGIPLVPV